MTIHFCDDCGGYVTSIPCPLCKHGEQLNKTALMAKYHKLMKAYLRAVRAYVVVPEDNQELLDEVTRTTRELTGFVGDLINRVGGISGIQHK